MLSSQLVHAFQSPNDIDVSFGAQLYALRIRRRMSQADLSRTSGYSKAYVSGIENSKQPAPPSHAVTKFAVALGLTKEEADTLMRLAMSERATDICFSAASPAHVLDVARSLKNCVQWLTPSAARRVMNILGEAQH